MHRASYKVLSSTLRPFLYKGVPLLLKKSLRFQPREGLGAAWMGARASGSGWDTDMTFNGCVTAEPPINGAVSPSILSRSSVRLKALQSTRTEVLHVE